MTSHTFGALGAGLVAAQLLGACGTTYEVEKVQDFRQTANDIGIYYTLPRTSIVLEVAVANEIGSYGRFYDGDEPIPNGRVLPDGKTQTFKQLLAQNQSKCPVPPATLPPGVRGRGPAPTLAPKPTPPGILSQVLEPTSDQLKFDTTKLSDYQISTSSGPDFNQLYRVKLDTGFLASYKHTIETTDRGVIKSADTLVKDGGSAFVQKTVGSLIKLATVNLAENAGGAAAGPGKDFCVDIATARAKRDAFKEEMKRKQDQRQQIVLDNAKTAETAAINLAVAAVDKEIAEYEKEKGGFEAANFTKTSKTEAYVGLARHNPIDFKPSVTQAPAWSYFRAKFEKPKDDKTPARIVMTLPGSVVTLEPVAAANVPSGVVTELGKVTISVAQSGGPNVRTDDEVVPGNTAPKVVCKSGATKAIQANLVVRDCGYRYRFPVAANVVIQAGAAQVASAEVLVAQYGPIIPMPNQFGGSSASLTLTYNDIGALTKAIVGSDPQATDTASGYIDAYATYRAAEIKDAQDEATKAKSDAEAAAKAETAALLAEKAYLEALKAVRELRSQVNPDE